MVPRVADQRQNRTGRGSPASDMLRYRQAVAWAWQKARSGECVGGLEFEWFTTVLRSYVRPGSYFARIRGWWLRLRPDVGHGARALRSATLGRSLVGTDFPAPGVLHSVGLMLNGSAHVKLINQPIVLMPWDSQTGTNKPLLPWNSTPVRDLSFKSLYRL
ncbi:hypothetical protein BD311DRAFT_755008 [Dichomitus squalens]|uniref:Uncharacterized protein n=1 Tax=Dichomitus squalens TaxID=114155 RepID=A0A4Q9MUD3_9APHY|nr:hypothetical protein BD311DRAFT_755008 [Dichomitus squalens]TBU53754.1 hypothetical protein BD310DRAFT_129493 [Dichomitus squalens]